MDERSIKKLRRKFMATMLLSFMLVMMTIGGAIYLLNFKSVRREARSITEYIIENDGDFPQLYVGQEALSNATSARSEVGGNADSLSDYVHEFLQVLFGTEDSLRSFPEMWHATRYFAVLFDETGAVEAVKTNHIATVEQEQARAYADIIIDFRNQFGSIGNYYYQIADRASGGKIIVCLDSTTQIRNINRILYSTLTMMTIGMVVAFCLVRFFSYKAIRPEIKAAELQKQFITNASHELKTPLAIIRANTEVEAMLHGKNEWNQSTEKQVDCMTGLIDNLVSITRASEAECRAERTETDIAAVIDNTVKTYLPVVRQEGLTLQNRTHAPIIMRADESRIRQLITIFIDNAIKYCDANGSIEVMAERDRKYVTIQISNTYKNGQNVDYQRFFDRFYRADPSHNPDKGGFGIGLSIAMSLTEQYGGKVQASWKDGVITFTCTLRG